MEGEGVRCRNIPVKNDDNRPFAASNSRGTKPPCWRAKVAPGQDKQRKLPFKIMYVFCLSCPSATFALQRGSFVPREELAAKGLLFDKYIYLSSIPLVRSSYSLKPEKSMIITVYTSQRIKPLHRVVGSLMNPHCGGLVKVARLDFFSGIPPKFEH